MSDEIHGKGGPGGFMNDQLKKIFTPVKELWGRLTKKVKAVIFACIGAVVLLSVILSLSMNHTQYTVLYSGLGSDEAQQVSDKLKTMDTDFKNENGTIYVDKNKEDTVRMQLANEGYPKTVPNYNFFTSHVGNMTTDEEMKIINQYSLQERLGAVIKTLDSVDTAYVTISLPKDDTYAWDDKNSNATTASVAVKLRNGKAMNSEQVNGIKQLISKSVPNLKADNVAVIDSSTGQEISTSSDSSSTGSKQITLSEFKLKIEQQYENNIQKKITDLLAKVYGSSHISVSVKSKMNLDQKIRDIITYTPTTSDGKGIVSHSEENNEVTRDGSSAGGVAGTQSNSDTTPTYPGITISGNVITAKDSKTYDYLVSKVEEQIQSDAAALDDLTVAVVITTNNLSNANQQQLKAVIANAAAVDPSKVAIMTVASSSAVSPTPQVVQASAFPQIVKNPLFLAIVGVVFVLILLLIIFSAKRRHARRKAMMENLQQETVMPPETAPVAELAEEKGPEPDDKSIEEKRSAGNSEQEHIKSQLQDFSSKNPEIAAQLIRSLLRGDDGKHG